jgi:RND family efflux transporter MFP subunit
MARNCLAGSLLLVALLAASGCHGKSDKPRLGEIERLPRVETVTPMRTTLELRSTLTATVEAYEKADLCARVRGQVKFTSPGVDIGRAIKEGDKLITLDVPDLTAERQNKKAALEQALNLQKQTEQARAVAGKELEEAKAQEVRYHADLDFRAAQYKRLAKLAQNKTVQPQLAEEAQLQHQSAVAALTAAEAQTRTKKARLEATDADLKVAASRIKVAQADLHRVGTLLQFATITAPFDGVITKRWVDTGATVNDPGTPLLTVMRSDMVRVVLQIPERDMAFVHVGGKPHGPAKGNNVVLRFPALGTTFPAGEFKGEITRLAAALDMTTRTMRAEVDLKNEGSHLRPQMTGTATVLLAEHDSVLTVPSSSLLRVGDTTFVYHLQDILGEPVRKQVQKAPVELGLDDGLRVEIRSGLTGNEQVIAKGNGVLRSGDHALPADSGHTPPPPTRRARAAVPKKTPTSRR